MTAEQLKSLRRKLRLTQAQFAAILGVHRVTVAKWENGSRAIEPLIAAGIRHKLYCQSSSILRSG